MNEQPITIAEQLKNDPRWQQAKSLIHDLLGDTQNRIQQPKPPNPDLSEAYHTRLETFSDHRGGKLYYPYLGSGIGRGALVELADGSVKYDLICGIGVHGLGHNHPRLINACIEAAVDDTVMQGNLQQNSPSAELAERFLKLANQDGAELAHCFVSSSGAMANENSLKLAFHYKKSASRIIAFDNCFAGRSMALSFVTDRPGYRKGLPETLKVDYIPFYDDNDPAGSTGRALRMAEKICNRYPEQHACMWLELVQGEGGYYSGSHEFFKTLLQFFKSKDIPIIIDEVQTFGRTPRPFAFQTFGLNEWADIVTVGKMSQVCATLYNRRYKPEPGLISQTFTSSSSAIRSALALFDYFEESSPFGEDGEIAHLRKAFADGFESIRKRHPDWLSGPYGVGTLIAFTPFDGDIQTTKRLLGILFERGIIAFLNGSNPSRIRFLPPMDCLTKDDMSWIMQTLEESLEQYAHETKG